jgi:formylglycine-generating enzyme required for sulfatase activity
MAEGYDDGFVDTAPVGSFPGGQSPYGALDMIGNVAEWVANSWDSGAQYRGGSWQSPIFDSGVDSREWVEASTTRTDVGFRCAYSSDQQEL